MCCQYIRFADVPRRGEPGSGTLGSGPHPAHPMRRRESGGQGDSPERRQTRVLRGHACKNLIKDRMERSGMRWTEEMAEAIVKLRAIYLSGDFDQYWPFHIQKDQERLHPAGRWSVVEK